MSTEAEILTPARKLSRPRITPAEKAARSSNSQSSAMPQDHRCLCPLLSRAGDTESWRPVFLTVTETATKLSQHRSAVLRLIHTGQMHSVRLGRTYRIPEANVHSLLAGKPDNRAYLTVEECLHPALLSRHDLRPVASRTSRRRDQQGARPVPNSRRRISALPGQRSTVISAAPRFGSASYPAVINLTGPFLHLVPCSLSSWSLPALGRDRRVQARVSDCVAAWPGLRSGRGPRAVVRHRLPVRRSSDTRRRAGSRLPGVPGTRPP